MSQFGMSELAREMTMEVEIYVTGVRWFKFKCWLGAKIMRLAARIIGCGIEIKGP